MNLSLLRNNALTQFRRNLPFAWALVLCLGFATPQAQAQVSLVPLDQWIYEQVHSQKLDNLAQDSLYYVTQGPGKDQFRLWNKQQGHAETGKSYWHQVQLANPTDQPLRRSLVAGGRRVGFAAWLKLEGQGEWHSLPRNQRANWQTLFEVLLPPHSQGVLLLRSHGKGLSSVQPWWRLVEGETYDLDLRGKLLASAVFYGVLVAMGLFTLGFVLISRPGLFPWYLLWLGSSVTATLVQDGLGRMYFWPVDGDLYLGVSLTFVNGLAMMQLTLLLLKVPRGTWEHRIALLGSVIYVFLFAASLSEPLAAARLGFLFVLLANLYMLGLGVRAYKYNPEDAKLFLAGWSGVMLASVLLMVMLLMNQAFAAQGFWPFIFLCKACSMMQVVFWGWMISNQYQAEAQRSKELERLYDAALARYGADLEEKVAAATAKLMETDQTKNKLLSTIAHDLKGPFAKLVELSSKLHGKAPVSGQGSLLQEMKMLAQNTAQLTDDLLSWVKQRMQRTPQEPVLVNLAKTLADPLQLLRYRAEKKSQTLLTEIPLNPWISVDPSMILVVLRNLVSNAIKFTPEGGLIRVYAKSVNGDWEIGVADTGVGMPPPALNQVLGDSATAFTTPGTQQEPGTGMGLFLTKELLQQAGTRLQAESEPGTGSRFWFVLHQDLEFAPSNT